jgi:putative membrane protein
MNTSTPQRQSTLGILILAFDGLYIGVKAFWPFLIFLAVRIQEIGLIWVIPSIGAFALLLGVLAWLQHRNYTFWLDPENREFVVNKGVISKTRVAIPVERIQQVNINQSLLHRLTNIYSLDIDTAGSAAKEVSVRAISLPLARHLRENLLEWREAAIEESGDPFAGGVSAGNVDVATSDKQIADGVSADVVVSAGHSAETTSASSRDTTTKLPSETLLMRLSNGTLFKIGITTKYGRTLAVITGFFFTMYGALHDVISTFELNEEEIEGAILQSVAWISIGVVIGGLVLLMIIVNLSSTFLRHYDFRMTLQRRALQITSGLLEKKNTIIRREKVQFVSVSRNFFQKKFGFWELKVMQASSDVAGKHQGDHRSHVEIPGCDLPERDHLLKILFGNEVAFGAELRPNWRYLLRLFLVGLAVPLAIWAGLVIWAEPEILEFWHFVVGYSAIFITWATFQYRNARLLVGDHFIAVQRGAWDIRRDIFEPYKIQGVTLKQALWHRRLNIGHLVLHTAAGDISFKYGDYNLLRHLADRLLYEAESSQRSWM